MTAEIAILNRSAIALAADSAVTITVGEVEKIYNSAEKIFEFSRQCPIGLMIYNSLDFMGYPWDVLIRRYREEQDEIHKTVATAAEKFIEFLSQLNISDENEDAYLATILREVYGIIFKDYEASITQQVAQSPPGQPLNFSARAIFHSEVEGYTAVFEREVLADFLSTKTQGDFDARYGAVCNAVATEVFDGLPLADVEFEKLRQLAFLVVRSTTYSEDSTGLVFTGYADGDYFPSLISIGVDGRYFGELKRWTIEEESISRDKNPAAILPFAQRDMADRFVHGIDDEFEEDLARHVSAASEKLVQKILDFVNAGLPQPIVVPPDLIHELAQESEDEFRDPLLRSLKELRLRDIYDIVSAMPKAELAQMAEALVSLTSIKRRVSLGSETVGGPVDVAVITRSEGFVWIKRKLYFESKLNPGFFNRRYGGKNADKDEVE